MKERIADNFMKQIVEGYKYLIDKGILHRDLKPANVLMFKNTNTNNINNIRTSYS